MEGVNYITDGEREKCRQVVNAFAKLYELADIIVVDAGKYGFVKLQYYREPQGFELVSTFTDSGKLFDALWQDWFEEQVFQAALGTPLEELEYEEIFAQLSEEKQDEIMSEKGYFESRGLLFTEERV